jgi:hypothetical protein
VIEIFSFILLIYYHFRVNGEDNLRFTSFLLVFSPPLVQIPNLWHSRVL